MSRSRRRFLAQLGGGLLLGVTRSGWTAELMPTPWQTDYQRAQRMRANEQRPMLVFVTMDGCPYCHKMMRATYQESGVAAEAAETFVLTVINGSEQADLAKQFGVRIYPTTYVIDAQNRLVDRIEGYIPAEQFRRRLTVASRRLASRPDAPLPR